MKQFTTQLVQHLHNTRQITASRCYDLIVGDFNSDFRDQSQLRLLPNYRQIVNEATTDYDTLIDHVYTDIPSGNINSFCVEVHCSDHKALIVTIAKDML